MSAAAVPSGTASNTAMMVAMIATCIDSSRRVLISSITGRSVHIDLPRSRVASPIIQSPN